MTSTQLWPIGRTAAGATLSPTTGYDTAVLADSPLGYWKMDERSGNTLADASPNNRPLTLWGGNLGAPAVMPLGAASTLLNGNVGQYARAGYASWMDSASFSVDAWIAPTAMSGYHAIIGRDWTSPRGWVFYVKDSKLTVVGPATEWAGATTLLASVGYHVAITYNSSTSTLKFYVNGVLDGTFTSITLPNSNSLYDLYLGVSKAGTVTQNFPFGGNIDHIAYYGTELSATRILAHYNASLPALTAYDNLVLTDTPYAYWPLSETGMSIAFDRSGNGRHGYYTGTAGALLPAAETPARGPVYGFDGNSGFVQCPADPTNKWQLTAWTVECWAKFPYAWANSNNEVLLMTQQFPGSGGLNMAMGLNIGQGNAGKFSGGFYVGSWKLAVYATVIAAGVWHHYVTTYSGGTLTLYLDGTQVAQTTGNGATSAPSGSPTYYLAHRWDTAQSPVFTGCVINKAAIYATALSSAQIAAHYAAG